MTLWLRKPTWDDPRLKVLALQTIFVLLGMTLWGFNRSPLQVCFIVFVCVSLDVFFHYWLRARSWLFPLSAAITGMGLSILTNFSHGLWLAALPPFFAIASKYLCTVNGRHVYNPGLFGVVMALFLSQGMITPAPAYQWGGSGVTAFFVATAALMLFALNIRRSVLIASFLLFYALQLALRAWILRHHIPPETLFMGAFSSPAFYLFTFFMITDPATSPNSRGGQVGMAAFIVVVDLLLHRYQQFSTLFYAGFLYFTLRWGWLLVRQWRTPWLQALALQAQAWLLVLAVGVMGLGAYRLAYAHGQRIDAGFSLVPIDAAHSNLTGSQGDIWQRTDPRMQHVAKWLLSVGDAAAVADVNNDGLPDVFLTQPLKAEHERAQLWLNQGDFRFQRFDLPMLKAIRQQPERYGLVSSATWFDMDNDGDQDLLLGMGFGRGMILENQLAQTGQLAFDVRQADAGLGDYQISVATNVLDFDQDGLLDIMVGNVMHRNLAGYDKPTPFNIFKLPAAEYQGDRRMFDVMHRSWHDANNADEHLLYRNLGAGRFAHIPAAKAGFEGKRWTMAIATGDLNDDGWPDIYVANDFGPDELYINQNGRRFVPIKGRLSGSIGRDTYKGMNASLGDVDDNGRPDIHVSNVHHKLQAEGSLMWMNYSQPGQAQAGMFRDEAGKRNALNEHRFGWGAGFGDLNRDGRLDMIQANGMADDAYDHQQSPCPDYWYWNAQIALTNPDVHGYADRWADVRGRCIFGNEANRVYLNQGDYFVDVASQVGLTRLGTSRGVVLADFDNDGDLDVLITHMTAAPSLYRNDSQPAGWLGLELVGNGSSCNRDALGTKVTLLAQGGYPAQHREVYANNGLAAQSDKRLLLGLGQRSKGDVTLSIRWCGRGEPHIVRVASGQYHRLAQ